MTALTENAVQPRLLIATNNRFWRGSIGSNARVAAVYQHFVCSGWDVTVAFCGQPYGTDQSDIARLGARVNFSQPAAPRPEAGESSMPTRVARVKRLLRRAQRWLRAAATQLGRVAAGSCWLRAWQEVNLRAQEPRVSDGVDHRFIECVRAAAQDAPPDVVLVEYVVLAWLLPRLKPELPAHTVWLLDAHDVMHERQQRFHALGEVHHLDISAREEARWLSAFDAVLAIQARDAEKFRALGLAPSRVITMPHPVATVRVPQAMPAPVGVGFLGSAMTPNSLAVQELLAQVWPRVQAEVGTQACLVLAGAVCSDLEGQAPPSGVRVLGYLDRLDDFYSQVDIVASPVRLGGGLKIKNVEALCKGKALITTGIGAEGLEDGAGMAYLLIQEPEEMAAEIVRLVRSPQALQALSEAGSAYAAHAFSPAVVFAGLDAFLAPLVRSAGARKR